MTEFAANMLIRRLEKGQNWPAPYDRQAIARIAKFAAYRESDEDALRAITNWPSDRDLVVDPLPERISSAKADLLYGEDPSFGAADDRDQPNLDRIVERSDLPAELHWAEQIRSSEGEVWARIQSSPALDAPTISFHSREVVSPLYVGAALVAVAFTSEFEDPREADRERPTIWRHLEIHSIGRVENRLYRGTKDRLGDLRPLTDFAETEDLQGVWDTGVPDMLPERILNRRGRDRVLGRSDYEGREQLLDALNEATTIGAENVRLVAKRRVVVPSDVVRRDPALPDSVDAGDGSRIPTRARFDAGEDVLVASSLDEELGKDGGGGPFKVLEYSFDAAQLIAWQDSLVKTIASRCGLTVAFLGIGDDLAGAAATGTALRVRLLPATSSAHGTARPWTKAVPRLLMRAQLLDAAPVSAGGFGRTWSKAGDPPAVERTDPLPRDETEEVQRHVTATGGPVESIETAVDQLHPDWSDERKREEVQAIRTDIQASSALPGFGIPPGTGDNDLPDDPPEGG